MKLKKLMSTLLCASMVISAAPMYANAETTTAVKYQDGTYKRTVTVSPTEKHDFDAYDVEIEVVVEGGKITSVYIPDGTEIDGTNEAYMYKALDGTKRIVSVPDQIIEKQSADAIDVVSGATCSSEAIIEAAKSVLTEIAVPVDENTDDNTGDNTGDDAGDTTGDNTGDNAGDATGDNTGDNAGDIPGEQKEFSGYVMMNIPYSEFYSADVKNDVAVDAFSSATHAKVRTGALSGGSYHVDESGNEITGITFPVKVANLDTLSGLKRVTDADSISITTTNRGQTSTTTYTGVDALFENPTYSYYVLDEEPAFYKELTEREAGGFTFGPVVGQKTTLSDASASITTETTYGDYQINVRGITNYVEPGEDSVYGVILETAEGSSYGLRHLENIWRVSELAVSTGFTKNVHGCPTSSAHYEALMGQHINKITYYTEAGIYEIPADLYVPVKLGTSLSVEDGASGDGSVAYTLTEELPSDFQPEYAVKDLEISVEDGKVTYTGAKQGKYTLEIKDASGKYASVKADFVLTTDQVIAAYNEDSTAPALTAAEGIAQADFEAYLKAITTVSVNGTSYAATGRGSLAIIGADGKVQLAAANRGEDIFQFGNTYELTVKATGYSDVTFSFTYEKAEQTITLETEDTVTKTMGESSFSLGAKSSADAALTYESSNTDIVSVDENGLVTIKGEGTATITIKAAETESYKEAEKQITVTVEPKKIPEKKTQTITAKSVNKVYGEKAFNLGAKSSGKTKLTYKSSNTKVVTVDKNGKVTIKGCGQATITIKASETEKYKAAEKKITVKVAPKKAVVSKVESSKKNTLKVTWKKDSQATGYEIQYSTSKTFKSGVKTKSFTKNSTVTTTVSKLTAKKTYYVRVRSYKTANGKKLYGEYSAVKSVKVK